jgi:hypothetical protein
MNPPSRTRTSARRAPRAPENRPTAAPRPAAPAPPAARDPWGWASALAVLAVVVHAWGAPLGEPVADDFACLIRARLEPGLPWFDGYGSALYWRPLARQVYFKLLAPVMLAHPGIVASLHAVLLALAALLLYRALRPRFGGPAAALAASFPLLMESTRMLISWPSNFQDLGALLFAVLAIHETVRGRLATTLASVLASLLCKELMAPAALLLPWLPGDRGRGGRTRWTLAIAGLVIAWGVAYAIVHRHAGLAWPKPSAGAAALAAPWLARYAWACWNGARGAMSLEVAHGASEAAAGVALGIIALAAIASFALGAPARARLRSAAPWALWGIAWFAAGSVTLAATFPDWSAYRGIFAAAGLGVALTALLVAAHPALAGALLAVRLVLFALSPGPPSRVTAMPSESGALFDFAKLVRVQRLVGDTRRLLAARLHPRPGARVGQHNLPLMTEYAFAGDGALQAWYRDRSLRWVRFEEYRRQPALDLAAIVEYQPDHDPQVALVEPAAMRGLLDGIEAIRRSDWGPAAAALGRADSLQRDADAVVFRATVASKRALCLAGLGDPAGAEREAILGLALWRDNFDSRYVLATVWSGAGRLAEAEAQLDTLLATYPQDRGARELLGRLEAARAGGTARRPAP